jgi:hypothetical protein
MVGEFSVVKIDARMCKAIVNYNVVSLKKSRRCLAPIKNNIGVNFEPPETPHMKRNLFKDSTWVQQKLPMALTKPMHGPA